MFDFNGDGLLDLLVLATVGKGPSMLFQNLGDFKFKRSKALPADLVGLGVAIGDITGNGWPDVFVGGPNRLFVNRGRGRFAALGAGVGRPGHRRAGRGAPGLAGGREVGQ